MRHYLPVYLLIISALFAQGLPGQGQGDRLTSRWSVDTVRVGEPVTLRLEVELPAGSVPHFSELTVTNPEASLIQTRLEPMAVEYVFTFWELGLVTLPGIPVKIVAPDGAERVVQTDSLSILVASVLTGREQDIREIKGMIPVILTSARSIWFRIGLVVVLLGVIALVWRSRRLRGPARAVKDEKLQPDAVAMRALGKLSVGRYYPAQAGESYLELSRVLRRYLEQRFLFRALEMTTSEIKGLLPAELDDPGTAALIGQVLEQSDLAKFAGLHQPKKQWREDLRQVQAIIDRTKPVFRV
ncbi:MAG: hypothetical protein GH143_05520 [Calditrichaeota bacterium]|nr:hypothetical protein [Calditrichota bacterium]